MTIFTVRLKSPRVLPVLSVQMVERVARVITEGLGENPDASHLALDETELRAWQQHEALARAVIEAMRDDAALKGDNS
ncbi:MAG: hypothetical protein O3A84_03030 [Proteobacteria bacterium]|nr:hypothetical protein [Pseudomonadota bacterium]